MVGSKLRNISITYKKQTKNKNKKQQQQNKQTKIIF